MQSKNGSAVARSALGLLLTTVFAASGCGGNDEETSTAAPLSKDEYVQRVEERCAAYQDEREAAAQPLEELGDPAQLAPSELEDASDDIIALSETTRQVISDLEAIPRPVEDTETLDMTFAAADQAVAALDDVDAAAVAGDGQALGAAYLAESQALGTVNDTGSDFGIDSCG
jgi:hypothetical protein